MFFHTVTILSGSKKTIKLHHKMNFLSSDVSFSLYIYIQFTGKKAVIEYSQQSNIVRSINLEFSTQIFNRC